MSREVAIDANFLLNFTVATCGCAIPHQPYTVGVQFQFV